jgi:hypothetical protein
LPLPFHPSYSLLVGPWYFRLGLRRVGRQAPVFVMLFHLTDFAAPLASAVLRPLASRWFTLSHLSAETKRARCAAMVADLRRTHEIVPTESLLDGAGRVTLTGMNS